MCCETKEDFLIAEKQSELLNELKSCSFNELLEFMRKHPEAEKEFNEGAGFIIGNNYDSELLECLPDSIIKTLKDELTEILYNKIWSGKIQWQI